MNGKSEHLNAADLCRVYAAAGLSVVWTPEQLQRFAKLLDETDEVCDAARKSADKSRDEARWWFLATTIVNLIMLGVWLYVGWS